MSAPPKNEQPSLGSGQRPPGAQNATILVVDNDPLALELLTRFLTREGFQVVTAASGEEALRTVRETRPAAITLDINMPGMNGWEVFAALKADPELSTIPIVMVTSFDERNKGFALGVTDFLLKPVRSAQLTAVLQKYRSANGARSALVVEDDNSNRELLVRLLRKEGCIVAEATNGRLALERALAAPPDLVLLDLMMPVMDGFSFLREMRQNPALRDTPVIVLTAKDLSKSELENLSSTVDRVLHKGTYGRDELLREIRKQLPAV
jgi:CheY-like chemotaxis protein